MTPEDLARLHARALTVPRPWTATEFAAFLADPAVILVHVPSAFALGRVAVDEAELLTLAVDPGHRRGGLGRACLSAFEHEARNRGARCAFLEVAVMNCAAIALYQTQGYVRTGTRPGYYAAPDGSRQDAWVMAHDLGGSAQVVPEDGATTSK